MNPLLDDLNLETLKISKELQRYVQKYWTVKKYLTKKNTFNIAPDGAMGLLINPGDNIEIDTPSQLYTLKHSEIMLLGIHINATKMIFNKNCNLVGIRFNPGAMFCFFNEYYDVLYQKNIILKDKDFYNKLFSDNISKENVLNTYLLDKFKEDTKINRIMYLFTYIENLDGDVNIDDLANYMSMNRRSLSRLFKKYICISPNIYLRIVKIKYTRVQLRSLKFSRLTDVSYDNRYFDQAHFIKEFLYFMSQNPKKYVNEKRYLSQKYNY